VAVVVVVSVVDLLPWCLVFTLVCVVEVFIGGGGGAIMLSSVVEVVEFVVVPSGVCTVVELAAGIPGALVLVVVVVCAITDSGSATAKAARS
jgi:hypothetical protein